MVKMKARVRDRVRIKVRVSVVQKTSFDTGARGVDGSTGMGQKGSRSALRVNSPSSTPSPRTRD